MEISEKTSAKERLRKSIAGFRGEIADQLRAIGRDITPRGVTSRVVAEHGDRIVLEFAESWNSEPGLRLVVGFNEDIGDEAWRSGLSDWLQVRFETTDSTAPVLTLGWEGEGDAASRFALYARLTDKDLPNDERGLLARADYVESAYARSDVLSGLAKDLRGRMGRVAAVAADSVPIRSGLPVVRGEQPPAIIVDADYEPVARANLSQAAKAFAGRTPGLDEINELLISEVLEALQAELIGREAQFAGEGVGGTVKTRFTQSMEWGMLVVAYAAEALTNQAAIGRYLGAGAASWVYGLIGPVVIAGLASLPGDSKGGKALSFAQMVTWASAMAVISASHDKFLDQAQRFFPKGELVETHERALALAKIEVETDAREVARLEGKGVVSPAQVVAQALKKWQAKEAVAQQREENAHAKSEMKAAQDALKIAQGRVSTEEFALRNALMKDKSRDWAWWSLLGIFGVINFTGPRAVGRVLEKWRDEEDSRKQVRADDHKARTEAKFLRDGRQAQKARAVKLMRAALRALEGEGIPADVLDRVDPATLASQAADRFDRLVNPGKYKGKAARLGLT